MAENVSLLSGPTTSGQLYRVSASQRDRKMSIPFQDDLTHPSTGGVLARSSSDDDDTVSSQAVASTPSSLDNVLSELPSQGPLGTTRPNTPVTITSRDTKKSATDNVRSVRGSASSGASHGVADVEAGTVPTSDLGKDESAEKGTIGSDGVGVVEDKVEYKTMGWVQAGIGMVVPSVPARMLTLVQ